MRSTIESLHRWELSRKIFNLFYSIFLFYFIACSFSTGKELSPGSRSFKAVHPCPDASLPRLRAGREKCRMVKRNSLPLKLLYMPMYEINWLSELHEFHIDKRIGH